MSDRELTEEIIETLQHVLRHSLAREDRQDLATLLPAVYALMGSSSWTAVELNARVLGDPNADRDLRTLLANHTSMDGGVRQLGRLLERCDGRVIGGLRLAGRGSERAGRLYAVKPTRVSCGGKHARTLPFEAPRTEDDCID
jgi:hypothetical protein